MSIRSVGPAAETRSRISDQRSSTHCYRLGGFEFREEIAQVDKRQVRRRLMARLREIIESRGGIWVRLSAYPFPYRSVFNLRSIYLEAGPEVEDALADLTSYEGATSHFLAGQAFENPSAFAQPFAGLDVGSLGYRPTIFDDTEENVVNLRMGISALRRLGLGPVGYAPPDGRFSLPLLSALEVLGVRYSSTTALCYDELPLFTGNSQVLQVPSHPLGVGGLPDPDPTGVGATQASAEAAAEALHEYFRTLIAGRYRAGEPVLLHRQATPGTAGSRVAAAEVLAASARCGALWRTTLSELADWWRARSQVRLRVNDEGEQISVVVEGRPAGFRVAAEFCAGNTWLWCRSTKGRHCSRRALWRLNVAETLPFPRHSGSMRRALATVGAETLDQRTDKR